ncbi:hypothetical protein BKI52_24445 [marine bacterium AO1-C]|nr:hypothetical protein BKI52_24445 [marine bacterium AO1-C]
MKSLIRSSLYVLLFLSIMVFSSCNQESADPTPTSNQTIGRILPIGASRVQGKRPDHESYRYDLWKMLVNAEKNFDFIGSQIDESTYLTFQGKEFDKEHQGRGGFTSVQILELLRNTIDQIVAELGVPDVVLLGTPGGNDGLQGLPFENAVQNTHAIIDLLQATNPNVTIIIEQAAPPRSTLSKELIADNERMNEEVINIAAAQTTSTSKVITVDMYTGFSDALLADGVHYNAAGARFIAERYFETLNNLTD